MPIQNSSISPSYRFAGLSISTHDVLWVVPLIAITTGLFLDYAFNLDHWLANTFYTLEGDDWQLRDAWLTSLVLHDYGQRFSTVWGVGLLGITALSFFWHALAPYRRGLLCMDVAIIASLLLVSLSKHMFALPCPWDLQRYGGDVISTAVYRLHPDKVGGCFPAGHAAGGYCLFALYFFARQYNFARARYGLLPGIIVGLVYGVDQELRGAHFLSHDLASASLCWFMSYFMFRLFFSSPDDASRSRHSESLG